MSEFKYPELERDFGAAPGARFFRQGDQVMFVYVVDAGTTIGPRPATARDRAEHAGVYRAFAGEEMDAAAEVAPESPHIAPLDMAGEVEPADDAAAESPASEFKVYDGYEPLSVTDEPEPAQEPEPAPGVIPEDWRNLHWKQKVKLAKELGAQGDISPQEAESVIAFKVAENAARAEG